MVASSPSAATSTAYPSSERPCSMNPATFRSSSTTSILMRPKLPAGRGPPGKDFGKVSSRPGLGGREPEHNPAAAIGLRLGHQVAAQEAGEPAGEREAEPVPLPFLSRRGEIDVEDPPGQLGPDPGSRVVDLEAHPAVVHQDPAHHRRAGGGMADRVAQEVDQDLLDAGGIAPAERPEE